jgi:hypothetical protein
MVGVAGTLRRHAQACSPLRPASKHDRVIVTADDRTASTVVYGRQTA